MENLLFILKSFVLGIVEGITEFLPISSTGHMIIFENLMNFTSTTPNYVEMYTYVIQLGAILAVVVLYWRKILDTLTNFFPKEGNLEKSGFYFWFMIGIACIPGFIVQMTLGDLADKYLFNPKSVSITLILGGFFMIFMENKFRNHKKSNALRVNMKQAWIIGLFQCLAAIPGMSRSASTIIGGWVSGLPSVDAAEFSFFLAIPVMIGMSILKLVGVGGFGTLTGLELGALAVGFVVSFIVALFVIKGFIGYLKKRPMRIFACYRIVFGTIILVSVLTGFIELQFVA